MNKTFFIQSFVFQTKRSPDLTPLDFYSWGYVKSIVYRDNIASVEQLKENINLIFENLKIQNTLENIRTNLIRKAQ